MAFKPFIPSKTDSASDPKPVEQAQDNVVDAAPRKMNEAEIAARFGLPDFLRTDVVLKVENDWTDPYGFKSTK